MLNKFFSKPVELAVGDQNLRFCSIPDFEFCLSGRTSVPSQKIKELVKLSPIKLKNEAITIKDVEKRFVSILSRSIEEPDSINRAMRELDPSIFSQDHSWREIIAALNEAGEELNPFRRVALVKYMQYLSARQDIIKHIYSEKQAQLNNGNGREEEGAEKLSGTYILESTLFEPEDNGKHDPMQRMPKGEVVSLQVPDGKEIDIRLSRHFCKLSCKNGVEFIDQQNNRHPLVKGKNSVGRDANSMVKIDPTLRDISRLHLLIEYDDDNHFLLTDMSAHGTFLAPSLLEHHTSTN